MCDLSNPRFHNEDKARAYLEDLRWPHGPVCPYCGDNARPVRGKSMGKGWYYCSQCQDKFTVRVGTVFERSKVPLHKWCMAMHLMASSKKGVSAHQLHRMLGVTYKTAWFMAHRIREAMSDDDPEPTGGKDKSVQADETYFGKKADQTPPASRQGRPYKSAKMATQRRAVFALVSDGKARTFHLHCYLAEFDFRYNHLAGHGIGDADRAANAALGAEGKRLTYRRTNLGAHLAA